ncbi:MAG TPA: hypothetical protein GYA07_03325 [Verrucomicrobia bacterium]|nr:hypothetical protein [Verrucomicrobiota bacterium]HOP96687.1 hypothetical protein [Verrucomicrobiota bacterium]HPU57843.1 hypothetical protein [Verrucomicrobiota bacterium]
MGLDIAFSDHHLDVETLREFGSVIRAIEGSGADPSTRFWAFLDYVSEHHPGILRAELEPEMKAKVTEALRGVALPKVTLRESPIRRHRAGGRDDDA